MKTTMRRSLTCTIAAMLAVTAIPALAQIPGLPGGQAPDEPIVTGAPYSAEGVTTVKARLVDGTRIERSVTAKFYRDSAGRVRREQTVIGLEVLDPSSDARAVIIISDPVAQVVYSILPAAQTAYRLAFGALKAPTPPTTGPQPKREALGTRDIDGETAVGSRVVVRIPAGQVGNDRPIEISDERWESQNLKLLLFSRHSDPRSGDVEYRVTKLTRGEPSRELFTVPAGYTITDLPPKTGR